MTTTRRYSSVYEEMANTGQLTVELAIAKLSLLREEMAEDSKRNKSLTNFVKDLMHDADTDWIYDGESGVEARLQERQASGSIDLVELAHEHPDIIVQLARDGALKSDLKVINDLTYAGELIDYMKPGSSTFALVLKKGAGE